ncbi:MAG: hypothetical protein MJ099_03075 [Clostridia bacterium]|nr:hypothetical protein [Clostridia bacterium]
MEIARAAEGGLRDALSLLDNCLAHTTEVVTDALARDVLGTTGRAFLFDFVDALIGYDAAKVMNLIAETVSRGSDPAVFAHDVTAHLRAVMLAAACGDITELADVTPEDAKRYSEQAAKTDFNAGMRMLELFLALSRDMKNSNRARTMLELAAMRACHPEKESAATADERLLRIEKLLEKGVPAASAVRSAVKSTPAAAPEVKAPAVPAAPVPRETPPEAFTEAVRIFSESTPSVRRFLQDMQFGGMKENVVTVEFDPKSAISLGIVKQKQRDLEQVLSDTFGTPIALNVTVMGQAAKKTDAARDKAVKDAITNSYSIFGRENVIVE